MKLRPSEALLAELKRLREVVIKLSAENRSSTEGAGHKPRPALHSQREGHHLQPNLVLCAAPLADGRT
jgi:hypothetical protein